MHLKKYFLFLEYINVTVFFSKENIELRMSLFRIYSQQFTLNFIFFTLHIDGICYICITKTAG
ncbi:hypothetical protein FM107_06830 [Sphingobacterium sp. JB170]|nr:hypothetical protein FM107_06830 [Sphingobacterium sp. JB170]